MTFGKTNHIDGRRRMGKSVSSEFKSEFGRRLRKARHAVGFTQGDLADKVGLCTASICYYERGRSIPNIELMSKMCSVLEVRFEDIVPLVDLAPKKVSDDQFMITFDEEV